MLDEHGMSRFWQKVDKSAGMIGCWIWLGHLKVGTYYQFKWNAKTYGVKKLAYESKYGKPAKRYKVACYQGNDHCCNPLHLILLDRKECVAS